MKTLINTFCVDLTTYTIDVHETNTNKNIFNQTIYRDFQNWIG